MEEELYQCSIWPLLAGETRQGRNLRFWTLGAERDPRRMRAPGQASVMSPDSHPTRRHCLRRGGHSCARWLMVG